VACGREPAVPAGPSSRFGDVVQTWSLTHCKTNGDGARICSESSRVAIDRRGMTFDWVRNTSPARSGAAVSWSGPGNMFFVRSSTLTLDTTDDTPHEKWVTGTGLAIAAPPEGVHLIQSFACKLFPDLSAKCTTFDLRSSTAGRGSYLVGIGDDVRVSTPIASVTDAWGAGATVVSPIDGRIETLGVAPGSQIARGASLSTMT